MNGLNFGLWFVLYNYLYMHKRLYETTYVDQIIIFILMNYQFIKTLQPTSYTHYQQQLIDCQR